MSHYGECRALANANAARAGCLQLWLSGSAAQQSLSCFPPTCSEAIPVERAGRIFPGLTVDSMSNMLSRNNETGHQPFHLVLLRLPEPASRYLTLMWFTLNPIYGFCVCEECSSYTLGLRCFVMWKEDLAAIEKKTCC